MFLKCIAIFSILFAGHLVAQDNSGTTSTTMESTTQTTQAADTASQAAPTKTTCSSAGDTRTIEVIYETPGSKVPCRVDYTKSTGTQTLWSAQNAEGYCEEKATGLAEKLQAAGFDCK